MERRLSNTLPTGKFENVPEGRARNMAAIRGRGNRTTEVRLRASMVRAGLRGWTMHPPDVPGKPDSYFASAGLAVFVDGCFWHGCPRCGHVPRTNSGFWQAKIHRNRQRDKNTRRRLRRLGIKAVRFWEHELRESTQWCIQRILDLLDCGK
ncbi:MAG TPA: very short patch repair endonuclease [Pirellulales bacterium]|nr:very short patch repair endonuclease [Pirellulales bacterium]